MHSFGMFLGRKYRDHILEIPELEVFYFYFKNKLTNDCRDILQEDFLLFLFLFQYHCKLLLF